MIMWTWHTARKIKNRYVKFIEIDDYFNIIKEMSEDETVPKYASQLIYLNQRQLQFGSGIEDHLLHPAKAAQTR
jgi:KUP system potassium uptake protein